LAAAKAVVVLWCRKSVKSGWVNKEARFARAHDKFLPCWIEAAGLPDEFASVDTINLSNWDAAPRSNALDRLLLHIGQRVGRKPAPDFDALRELDEDWRGFGAPSLAKFALGEAPEQLREAAPKREANLAISAIENIPAQDWITEGGDKLCEQVITASSPLALREAAEVGDSRAQVLLGMAFMKGIGDIAQRDSEAVRLMKLAANSGNANAQQMLGYFYYQGLCGLTTNEREAARLFSLAAEQGHATAQLFLGNLYWDGRGGLPLDHGEALRRYKMAAQLGSSVARDMLKGMGES